MKQPVAFASLIVSLVAMLVAALVASATVIAAETRVMVSAYQACVDYASFVYARRQEGLTPNEIDSIAMALSEKLGRDKPRETLVDMCGQAQYLLGR